MPQTALIRCRPNRRWNSFGRPRKGKPRAASWIGAPSTASTTASGHLRHRLRRPERPSATAASCSSRPRRNFRLCAVDGLRRVSGSQERARDLRGRVRARREAVEYNGVRHASCFRSPTRSAASPPRMPTLRRPHRREEGPARRSAGPRAPAHQRGGTQQALGLGHLRRALHRRRGLHPGASVLLHERDSGIIVAAVISLIAHSPSARPSRSSHRSWWSAGLEMTGIGALEGVVTYIIGVGIGHLAGS